MTSSRGNSINKDEQNVTSVTTEHFKYFLCGEYRGDQDSEGNSTGRSNVPNADLLSLATTSREMNRLFQPILDERIKAFIIAAIQGNDCTVENMIKTSPQRLLCRNKVPVYDRVKRKYQDVTVFEAALQVGDFHTCESLVPYFNKLTNGRFEMLTQFIHAFTENNFDMENLENKTTFELCILAQTTLKNHEERQIKATYSFDTIVNAITNATEDDITAQLNHVDNYSNLNQMILHFRKEFLTLSVNERVYNPHHLLKAMQIYNEQYPQWSEDKQDLFWRQIIGYTQRFMPIIYMDAFHGCALFYINNRNNPEMLKRSTKIEGWFADKFISFDKLDHDQTFQLGFDFAVYKSEDSDQFVRPPNLPGLSISSMLINIDGLSKTIAKMNNKFAEFIEPTTLDFLYLLGSAIP